MSSEGFSLSRVFRVSDLQEFLNNPQVLETPPQVFNGTTYDIFGYLTAFASQIINSTVTAAQTQGLEAGDDDDDDEQAYYANLDVIAQTPVYRAIQQTIQWVAANHNAYMDRLGTFYRALTGSLDNTAGPSNGDDALRALALEGYENLFPERITRSIEPASVFRSIMENLDLRTPNIERAFERLLNFLNDSLSTGFDFNQQMYVTASTQMPILVRLAMLEMGSATPQLREQWLKIIRLIAQRPGVDVNINSYLEVDVSLTHLARNGELEAINILLENGANVFNRDIAGSVPLSFATTPEVVNRLLEVMNTQDPSFLSQAHPGRDYQGTGLTNGQVMLYLAVINSRTNRETLINAYLRAGINPNARVNGEPIVHFLVQYNNLVGLNTFLNFRDATGQIVLDVNARNSAGETPLMYLAAHAHANSEQSLLFIEALLRAGADANLTNAKGKKTSELTSNDAAKDLLKRYENRS